MKARIKLFHLYWPVLFILFLNCCDSSPTETEDLFSISEITISPQNHSVLVDSTVKFNAEVKCENNSDCDKVNWENQNLSIGTIDQSGVYTAKNRGGDIVKACSEKKPEVCSEEALSVEFYHEITGPIKMNWYETFKPRDINGTATDVVLNKSNNLVVVGGAHTTTSGFEGGSILKIDSDGNLLWIKNIEISSSSVTSVAQNNQGDIYFSGRPNFFCGSINSSSNNTINPSEHHLISDATGLEMLHMNNNFYASGTWWEYGNTPFYAKLDSNCNMTDSVLVKSNGRAQGLAVSEEYLYVSGDYHDFKGNTNTAGYVQKRSLDDYLLWEWTKTDLQSVKVEINNNGQIYVAGTCFLCNNDDTSLDLYAAKLDKNGKLIWEKTWQGGENPQGGNWVNDASLTTDEKFIIAGSLNENFDNPNCYQFIGENNCTDLGIWVLDSEGNEVVKAQQDLNYGPWDRAKRIVIDSNDTFYLVGNTVVEATENSNDIEWLITKWTFKN